MIELPESRTLSRQAGEIMTGRTVGEIVPPSSPHKFTWYNGDPEGYGKLLGGKKILSAEGFGAFVELNLEDDVHLLISDGVNARYYPQEGEAPIRHQLAVILEDGAALVLTVAMYGGIYAYRGVFDNPYYAGARKKTSPLEAEFDREYFEGMVRETKKNMTAKALLATEQRIPGLGNGVLQDILLSAGVHPRRKVFSLTSAQTDALFGSVKETLTQMVSLGGRDTEKDLFGNPGGYRTLLSRNNYPGVCPKCGTEIEKEAFLGGTVYFCPWCQVR